MALSTVTVKPASPAVEPGSATPANIGTDTWAWEPEQSTCQPMTVESGRSATSIGRVGLDGAGRPYVVSPLPTEALQPVSPEFGNIPDPIPQGPDLGPKPRPPHWAKNAPVPDWDG